MSGGKKTGVLNEEGFFWHRSPQNQELRLTGKQRRSFQQIVS